MQEIGYWSTEQGNVSASLEFSTAATDGGEFLPDWAKGALGVPPPVPRPAPWLALGAR
jgi:hypothetical protein